MSANDFVQHGQEFVDSGQYQQAVKVCRLGLLAHPTAIAGRLVLGTALMCLRRYDEVLAEMRVALEIDDSNPRALALKGEALMHKGDAVQAAQILHQARIYAPDDQRMAELYTQAEGMVANADFNDFSPQVGDMTKHYPVHAGAGVGARDDDDDFSDDELEGLAQITRPRDPEQPYHSGLARLSHVRFPQDNEPPEGPQRNTMDIDPMDSSLEILGNISAVELVDDKADAGDSMEMTNAFDTNAMGARLASHVWDADFDDEEPESTGENMAATGIRAALQPPADPLALHAPQMASPQMPSPQLPSTEHTAHYRKPPSPPSPPPGLPRQPARPPERSFDRAPARPPARPPDRQQHRPPPRSPMPPPRDVGPDRFAPPRPRMPDLPLSAPPTGVPRQPSDPMPRLDALFPENDDGVSKILLMPDAADGSPDVEQAVRQIRAPHQPTLAISPANIDGLDGPPGPGLMGAKAKMDQLRQVAQHSPAGMADDPDLLQSIVEIDGQFPGLRGRAPASAPMGAPPPMAPPLAQPAQRPIEVRQPVPEPLTASMPRKRSLLAYLMYGLVAVAVVAGGVFAGFKIREIRLDKQIRTTEENARDAAREDTYAGYEHARISYARIVAVRPDDDSRSALARSVAALAGEFGEDIPGAQALVAELKNLDNLDVVVARAYLALALDDTKTALELAGRLARDDPDNFIGAYLSGRAAADAGDTDAALEAFKRALGVSQRPIVYIGLARVHRSKGSLSEAEDAFGQVLTRYPEHPEALIGQAAIAVERRALPDDVEQRVKILTSIVERDGDDALASRRQRARAALTLASIELLRDRSAAAKDALGRAKELVPPEDRGFSVDLMHALMDVGDADAAQAEAERALGKWPEDMDLRISAAEVALYRKQPQQAVDRLTGDIASNARALSTRGRAFLELGILEKAMSDLDASISLAPDSADVVVARAQADLRAGDAEIAAKRLKPLYSEDAAPEIGLAYASALRQARQRTEAREILERLVKLPRSGRAHLELARLERDDARFAKAKEAYDAAVSAFPDQVEIKLEAALLRLDTGDIKGALERLAELAEERVDNPRIQLEAARVFTMTGNYEKAERALDRAGKLATSPRWHVRRERGRLALRRGRIQDALGQLSSIPDLSDQDSEVWLLLLQAQLAADDIEAARATKEAVYKKFQLSEPVRDMARARLALYDDRLKDALEAYDSARKKLKKLRATPRQLADVYYWQGRAYVYADKLEDARDAMATAVDNDPGHADAHFWLGFAHLNLKKPKDAETSLRAAMDIDPAGNPEAWYYLGEAVYQQKKWTAAKEAFEAYLERYPEGDFATDARRFIRQIR